MAKETIMANNIDTLVNDIKKIINQGRQRGAVAVNSVICMTYWEIGQRIVEEEQLGKQRAEYGRQLLKMLAMRLSMEYGNESCYTARDLRNYRQFYLIFKDFPKSALDCHEYNRKICASYKHENDCNPLYRKAVISPKA